MTCFFCEGLNKVLVLERLTFDQLFSVSEPKRVLRSKTVRGPPLDVDAKKDGVFYNFNFKSFPSTTGKRQKGYIKFFKPKKKIPLEKVECLVDCTCPDYRYRWAWTNKQRGSSVVGAKSMNQAFNRAPKITNPKGKSGLCKHLLALRDFIYGEYENFDGEDIETPERLDAVVQAVQSKGSTAAKPAAKVPPGAPKKPGKPAAPVPPKTPTPPQKPKTTPAVAPKPPSVIRPTRSQSATTRATRNQVPDEFRNQTLRNFSKVESVFMDVKDISQIILDADDVQVDPESSEALQLLREIRDALKVLADKEEPSKKEEPPPPPEEGPTPDDIPELEPETAEA